MESNVSLLRTNWGSLFKSHGIKLEKVELTNDCLSIYFENHYLATITKKDSEMFMFYWEKDKYKDYLNLTRSELLAMFGIEEQGNEELKSILQVNHYSHDLYSINTKAYCCGDSLVVVNTEYPKNSDSFLYLFMNQKLRNTVELFCFADSLPHFWNSQMWRSFFRINTRNTIEIRKEDNSLFVILSRCYMNIMKTESKSQEKEFRLEWHQTDNCHEKNSFVLSRFELLTMFNIQEQKDMILFINNRSCINSNSCRKNNELVIVSKSNNSNHHLYMHLGQELKDAIKKFLIE